jgi:hypothetical protein
MWIMVSGPYRSGTADASERARNLAALNEESGRPVYGSLGEVPGTR